MTSVLGYARTFFLGGHYRPAPLPSLSEEVERFHEMLADLGSQLEANAPLLEEIRRYDARRSIGVTATAGRESRGTRELRSRQNRCSVSRTAAT